jgi:nucleoside-diphosphate-sugar epimerase
VIAVTGATGFVGRALVAELALQGLPVRAIVRADRGESWPAGTEVRTLPNFEDAAAMQAALTGATAVIHCAARAHVLEEASADPLEAFRKVNRDGTLALARAAVAAGVKRFVFVSSVKVNGERTNGTPFRADDVPVPETPYGLSKKEAEIGLREIADETGLEVVIVRPPLVIGAHAKGNLGTIARLIRRGLPLPFGGMTRNRRDLVSLNVLADLLIRCATDPRAAGHIFMAGDGVTRSTAEIVRTLARYESRSARLVPIPAALIGVALKAAGRTAMHDQLLGDLEVDIGPTRAALDWRPSPAA